jgi:hypothetical protein
MPGVSKSLTRAVLSGWYGQSTSYWAGGSFGYLQSWVGLPFEVAKLAVEDPDDSVRYWMARNARYLDYSEWNSQTNRFDDTHPERNLKARLRADPVPVVGAAVFENPRLYDSFLLIDRDLPAMSRLERLACMRNPYVLTSGAQKVAGMDLPMEEREELILALLTNRSFVENARSPSCAFDSDYAKLWDTISRFPDGDAKLNFFRRIYALRDKKTEIYKGCERERLRCAILEGCDATRYDDLAVLELGTADSRPDCRQLAYSKLPVGKVHEKLRVVLKGSDKASILGLYSNPNVTATQLEAIGRRAGELDLWDEARDLRRERTAADMALSLSYQLPSKSARYRGYAWEVLWGLAVVALSLALLVVAPEGQRALFGVLIIACSTALWLARSLPFQLAFAANNAGRRFNELRKLLGAKDLTESEEQTFVATEHLLASGARIFIRGIFWVAVDLLAIGGVILALLR